MKRFALRQALLSSLIFSLGAAGCATQPPAASGPMLWAAPAPEAARLLVDADQDGLSADRERQLGSRADAADTDGDGFNDGFEVRHGEFGFDPLRATLDSDRDGLPDRLESSLRSDRNNVDSDGDGYGDFDEYFNRLYGFDLRRPTRDSDFDGLADDLETRLGSALDRVDTNDDGVTDFQAHYVGASVIERFRAGGRAELIGITYSQDMAAAIAALRGGAATVSPAVAAQLPYPEVTTDLVLRGLVRPSAALMQRAVHNPTNSPAFYRPFSEVEAELFAIANHFDGSPGPAIVRFFVWSAPTLNCCSGIENVPGERIYLLKISDNPERNESEPEVAILGMHHGRELITVTITMNFVRRLTRDYEANDPRARDIVDNRELWVLPVINPNGYERARAVQADWRKNTRRVSRSQINLGVDLNRNYSASHASTLTSAQRAAMPSDDRSSNGITSGGGLDENSYQYPNSAPFSEVETQAVRGLGFSQFNTQLGREEVSGLGCSLSWHSYTGLVGHPLGHHPIPPEPDLTGAQRAELGALSGAFAGVTNYQDNTDQWRNTNYAVLGDSEDWLFRQRGVSSVFVEAYSVAEGRVGGSYFPPTAAEAEAVAQNNYEGALAFIRACQG